MKKQLTVKLLGYEITLQIRDNRKSRFDDIIIDAAKKQKMLDSIDIDSIREKARAMRAIHNTD
jgi:hypothetical protein